MRTPAILDASSATPGPMLLAARLGCRPVAFGLPTAAAIGMAAHLTVGPAGFVMDTLPILYASFAWTLSAVLGRRTVQTTRAVFGPVTILGRLRSSGRGRTIVAALEEQWPACRIEIHAYGISGWYGEERRTTTVHFPSGAHLQVTHSVDGTAVHFHVDRHGRGDLLSTADQAMIAEALLRLQIRALAMELGLPWDIGAHALSHAIGAMSEVEATKKRFDRNWDIGRPPVVVERRTIPKKDVSIVAARWESSSVHHELLVEGRRTGVVSLPAMAYSLVVRDDEAQVAAKALDVAPAAVRTPVVPGPSRAERLTTVARLALARDPDLADASGTPIASLIDSHLPRLVKRHRAAEPSVRRQADETFEQGLDVVARAVGESIDSLANRSLDDLRTEVRFLETRHPQRDPLLSPEVNP